MPVATLVLVGLLVPAHEMVYFAPTPSLIHFKLHLLTRFDAVSFRREKMCPLFGVAQAFEGDYVLDVAKRLGGKEDTPSLSRDHRAITL